MSTFVHSTTSAKQGALVLEVEQRRYALALDHVVEVVRGAQPLAAPRAPFGCLGLLDLRGELVVLVDLAVLLSLRRPLREHGLIGRLVDGHVIVVRVGQTQVALLVDQVHEVDPDVRLEALADDERARLATGALPAGLLEGAAMVKGERVLALEVGALIGARRRALLSSYAARGEARP